MGLKTFKPYTKSTRGTVVIDKSNLWKGAPYKPLTKVKILLEEEIITEELHQDILVEVLSINIGLLIFTEKEKYLLPLKELNTILIEQHMLHLSYEDKEKAYIISPQGLKQGDVMESGKMLKLKLEIL